MELDKLDKAIRGISRNDPTLTILDLRSHKVGESGAGRLAETLASNSALATLNLNSTVWGTKDQDGWQRHSPISSLLAAAWGLGSFGSYKREPPGLIPR